METEDRFVDIEISGPVDVWCAQCKKPPVGGRKFESMCVRYLDYPKPIFYCREHFVEFMLLAPPDEDCRDWISIQAQQANPYCNTPHDYPHGNAYDQDDVAFRGSSFDPRGEF